MSPALRGYSPPEAVFVGAYPAVQATESRMAQINYGIGGLLTARQIHTARVRVAERVPRADLLDILDMLGLGPQVDPCLSRPIPIVDRPYNHR